MRSLTAAPLLPMLFAAVACRKAAPPRASSVVFTKAPPAIGARRERTTSLALEVPGLLSLREACTWTEEPLGVAGLAITEAGVTFRDCRIGGRPSAVAGRSYVLRIGDAGLEVRRVHVEGGDVSPEESEVVVSRIGASLGSPDPLTAALPDAPLAPGERVDAIAEALARAIGRALGTVSVREAKATFAGSHDGEGVFDLTLGVSRAEPPVRIEASLTGQARIDVASGAPASIRLEGPVRVTPDSRGDAGAPPPGNIAIDARSRPL